MKKGRSQPDKPAEGKSSDFLDSVSLIPKPCLCGFIQGLKSDVDMEVINLLHLQAISHHFHSSIPLLLPQRWSLAPLGSQHLLCPILVESNMHQLRSGCDQL